MNQVKSMYKIWWGKIWVRFVVWLSPRPLLYLLVLLGILLIPSVSIQAQSYYYTVPELQMQVFIQPDGGAHIVYDITFTNNPSGEAIRIIDIGTPDSNYDLSNMSASIDGAILTDIRHSEVLDTGVEIHLNDRLIPAGETSTFHFEFTMPEMVYQDTTDAEYASFRISPTWFDPAGVSGTSDIWVAIHVLPGIDVSELLYQQVPFTDKINFEDHSVASWRWENGVPSEEHLVALSFPKRGMLNVIEQSPFDLAVEWLNDHQGVRVILGVLTLALFGLAYMRFTGGTGIVLLVSLSLAVAFVLITNPIFQLILLPVALILIAVVEWILSRRKPRYFPAVVQVEGGGIKRGLTAPEAGVVLELPLNKILTLVVFGLLEKGIFKQIAADPLELEITPEFQSLLTDPDERQAHRLRVAQNLGVVVRLYEHRFIDLLEKRAGSPVYKIDFSRPMKALITHSASRMKGFDLSDTRDYYRAIIKKAIEQASEIGDIPERERYLDSNLQWLLLDDDYSTVFMAPNYHYRPVWIRPFHSSDRISTPSASRTSSPGQTSFTDVSSSFAGWTEKTMGRFADAIAPGALQVKGPSGAVNLSGIDRVTGDVFQALSESSGSGGGSSSGGCACACAGCACACACAGGGR
ncbi:MAG: hypothetical protein WA996_06875 [Candidatus Promineifilaceae bacterium]